MSLLLYVFTTIISVPAVTMCICVCLYYRYVFTTVCLYYYHQRSCSKQCVCLYYSSMSLQLYVFTTIISVPAVHNAYVFTTAVCLYYSVPAVNNVYVFTTAVCLYNCMSLLLSSAFLQYTMRMSLLQVSDLYRILYSTV